ncbi:hypothetical protein COU37_04535 [Candidatus Micrarchaeota archaeon CG10_big_fil_rev_8_21_14_0_10_45_29]|nr:MAG: hypothetical protein COU37_04535 [Candidatus Micrarchaeota archaeon CG10_big_fil_rev_8_21_14_0_10_45_29]
MNMAQKICKKIFGGVSGETEKKNILQGIPLFELTNEGIIEKLKGGMKKEKQAECVQTLEKNSAIDEKLAFELLAGKKVNYYKAVLILEKYIQSRDNALELAKNIPLSEHHFMFERMMEMDFASLMPISMNSKKAIKEFDDAAPKRESVLRLLTDMGSVDALVAKLKGLRGKDIMAWINVLRNIEDIIKLGKGNLVKNEGDAEKALQLINLFLDKKADTGPTMGAEVEAFNSLLEEAIEFYHIRGHVKKSAEAENLLNAWKWKMANGMGEKPGLN